MMPQPYAGITGKGGMVRAGEIVFPGEEHINHLLTSHDHP